MLSGFSTCVIRRPMNNKTSTLKPRSRSTHPISPKPIKLIFYKLDLIESAVHKTTFQVSSCKFCLPASFFPSFIWGEKINSAHFIMEKKKPEHTSTQRLMFCCKLHSKIVLFIHIAVTKCSQSQLTRLPIDSKTCKKKKKEEKKTTKMHFCL